MGDAGKGLYVHAAVADAVTEDLVSRADLITPNAWELSRLSNHPVFDAASALAAARSMGRPVAVTSVEAGGEIGVVYADRKEAHLAVHARERSVPNGTGDLFCALMTAALMDLYAPREALAAAVGGVADAVADAGGLKELPITALPTELSRSDRVRLETLA
jgi:pyridoxine kinase